MKQRCWHQNTYTSMCLLDDLVGRGLARYYGIVSIRATVVWEQHALDNRLLAR
jgi:aryl-alcohol dehydrogenase-like predicted oxidoreductase